MIKHLVDSQQTQHVHQHKNETELRTEQIYFHLIHWSQSSNQMD